MVSVIVSTVQTLLHDQTLYLWCYGIVLCSIVQVMYVCMYVKDDVTKRHYLEIY